MTALETVYHYYNYFNAKNFDGMLSLLDPNIRHEPNQGEPRLGLALFTEFMQMMDECYEETITNMVFYTEAAGEKVAAEFTVNGVYKKADEGFPPANGQSYVLPAASFLEVKNGKITRVATFYNLPLWIKLVSENG